MMKARIAVTMLAIGFSSLAFAQQNTDATDSNAPAFEQVDANSDGQVSRTEAAKVEGLDWTKADVDGNGSLSKQEYDAATGHSGEGSSGA